MNRKHRTSLRTALAGTLALAALTGAIFGGVADDRPQPATSFGPVALSQQPATSFGAVADYSPDSSLHPASSFGPVADYSPDSSLHPAGSLSSL